MVKPVKDFYSEYWKPIIMIILPAVILTFFSSYSGVKIAIIEERKEREKLELKINSYISEFTFYKAKDQMQGEALHRLELNQFSIAKDCQLQLPYDFKNLTTRSMKKQ